MKKTNAVAGDDENNNNKTHVLFKVEMLRIGLRQI